MLPYCSMHFAMEHVSMSEFGRQSTSRIAPLFGYVGYAENKKRGFCIVPVFEKMVFKSMPTRGAICCHINILPWFLRFWQQNHTTGWAWLTFLVFVVQYFGISVQHYSDLWWCRTSKWKRRHVTCPSVYLRMTFWGITLMNTWLQYIVHEWCLRFAVIEK